MDNTIVDNDGKNVEKGKKYVSKYEYEKFKNLIMRAEKICDNDFPNEIYDYNVYLLYLANFGSQSDIGAKFAGFNYEGFDNQVHVK